MRMKGKKLCLAAAVTGAESRILVAMAMAARKSCEEHRPERLDEEKA